VSSPTCAKKRIVQLCILVNDSHCRCTTHG